jgi:WD40 repeat protein
MRFCLFLIAAGALLGGWWMGGSARAAPPPPEPHPPRLNSAAVSPDGKMVAAGYTYDGMDDIPLIRLWDPATGKELLSITGPKWAVDYIAFTPDGKYVLSGGAMDGAFRLWDAKTGKAVRTFAADDFLSYGGALSADGKRLLTVGRKHTGQFGQPGEVYGEAQWRLWDFDTGKVRSSSAIREKGRDPAYLPASPDCTKVLYNGKLLDVESGRTLRSFDPPAAGVFSPNGKAAVFDVCQPGVDTTKDTYHLELWNLDDDRAPSVVGRLADGGESPPEVWNSDRDKQPVRFPTRGPGSSAPGFAHPGYSCWITFSPDGKGILTADSDGMLRLWDVAAAKQAWAVEMGDCKAAAFTAQGKEILAVGEVVSAIGPTYTPGGPGRMFFRYLDAASGKLVREP